MMLVGWLPFLVSESGFKVCSLELLFNIQFLCGMLPLCNQLMYIACKIRCILTALHDHSIALKTEAAKLRLALPF